VLAAGNWYERDAHAGILQELGPKLSASALITLEGDEAFGVKTERWVVDGRISNGDGGWEMGDDVC
jgi:hypothetical protein